MSLAEDLTGLLPSSRIHTQLIDRIAYANDASYFRLVPQAVVQPNSPEEIRSLFKFSQQRRIPMTFRAAGTSLSGQAVTDGLLVDLSRHWGLYHVEEQGALIRTQPGIVGAFLNNVLKPYGRRIGPDPASIDACMMGGILANNSSGMCCGVSENAYRTLHSMTFLLPNGFMLDTARPEAAQIFESEQRPLAEGLRQLKQRLLADPVLAERVRRRHQMKNNNGYLLNAFLDFDTPLDILTHLLIGSEGTLGFIAEAVLRTLPDYHYKYTGQLYFKTVQDAAAAIDPLRKSGVRAAEIMDRASLRSVENLPGAPALISQLPDAAAAILVEYQGETTEELAAFRSSAAQVVSQIKLLYDAEFTEEPARQAVLWKLRKGIIPSVGAMRPPATTMLMEDVVFPIPRLAEAVTDLQHMFVDHNYPEGSVFGHAKDGNLHFLIAQSFNTPADVAHFDRFVGELVKVVTGKYDGALKAEHGTGRNMAPFVETEWGARAYAIMRDLKALLDPDGMLNPGVVINPDPQAHITDVKDMPGVGLEVDKCIECGFCESKCPSRRLTPRQRIVVQREISRLRAGGAVNKSQLASLTKDYRYAGLDTCALDGLCATACPVSINTGELTRRLRAENTTWWSNTSAGWMAGNFRLVENAIGAAVSLGHKIEPPRAHRKIKEKHNNFPAGLAQWVERITGWRLPKWIGSISAPAKNLKNLGVLGGDKQFVYFPSCISRQLGTPPSTNGKARPSLAGTLVTVAGRAGINLWIPPEVEGTCCGMPFNSKGFTEAYRKALHHTIDQFWNWSQGGRLPIVIDASSCTHTLRNCGEALSPEDLGRWQQLTLLDSLDFIHDILLPALKITPVPDEVLLHPNCSARKLGLENKLTVIAQKCAKSARVPLNLDCCGFAGDRGLLFPELTASATVLEAAEVLSRDYDGYYSSNITCEMGMREATGKDYVSIVYLVEKASRPDGTNPSIQ